MKKIIYSLVIMIAAGSLFTSCIEQVEPVGLLDMRTAKAEYIRALKDLRAADAEYTRAKAAVEQANARYRDAETAFKNAQVENQKLLNDLQELWNEAQAQENTRRAAEIAAEIEGIQMKMEELAAKHAVEMVKYEAQLAQAQEGLRVVLRDIAIASKSLSPNEKLAVIESAALVAVLSDAQAKAMKDVNEAQQKLDTLTFKALVAGTTWADGYLEDLEEHYEDLIEEEQAKIAIAEVAKALVPLATAQISEWQDIVDGYAEDSLAIAQEMAQQTYDSTAYINATVKPGIVKFNQAIAEFIEENWETPNMGDNSYKYAEPALTPAEEEWIEKGAPKKADYYNIPVPAKPTVDLSGKILTDLNEVNFNKYAWMLVGDNGKKSYGQKIPATADTAFMIVAEGSENAPDTLKITGTVDKGMKTFLVGSKETGSVGSQTWGTQKADYGLWGAWKIMERVYQQTKRAHSEGWYDTVAQKAKAAWVAANDTLSNGLKVYQPYVDALDELEDAREAFKIAYDADSLLAADLAEAVANLKTVMVNLQGQVVKEHYASGADFDQSDTALVIAAMKGFAIAREQYLEQPGVDFHDSTMFYFRTGWDASKQKPIVDSTNVAFTAIEQSALSAHAYDMDWQSTVELSSNAVYGKTDQEYTKYNNGIANIANQLLGNRFAKFFQGGYHLNGKYVSNAAGTESSTSIVGDYFNVIGGIDGFNDILSSALFNTFVIGEDGWVYNVNTHKRYYGEGLEEAYEDLLAAEAAVMKAYAEYGKIYNAYWGVSAAEDTAYHTVAGVYAAVTAGGEASVWAKYMAAPTANNLKEVENVIKAKFDATKRMDQTDRSKLASPTPALTDFDPYADGTPLVTFADDEIIPTTALQAVLTAVDPLWENKKDNDVDTVSTTPLIKGTASFWNYNTLLYKALKAAYDYYYIKNIDKVETDLADIAKWIGEIEQVFDNNKPTTKDDPAAWTRDSSAYAKAVARKDVVDAYMVEKVKFVGTRTEQVKGKDSVFVNDLFIMNDPIDTITTGVSYTLNTTADPFASLFATNLFGEYVGWTDKLDGKQLANAKEFFGEKPYEQIQDWKVAFKVNQAKQETLHELKELAEAVFVQKARVEGLADEPDSTTLASIQNSWKTYVETLDTKITEAKNKINGDPDVEGDKGYAGKLADAIAGNIDAEYLIKDAQIELAAAEARLENITKLLEKAQANLDKIMEYIRSTDAEFVIPVTIEEIDALINSVKTKTTLSDEIAAMIATYITAANYKDPTQQP